LFTLKPANSLRSLCGVASPFCPTSAIGRAIQVFVYLRAAELVPPSRSAASRSRAIFKNGYSALPLLGGARGT